MKVFLSHASADKPTVLRIGEGLEAEGLEVWIDEAGIRVGQSIPAQIAEGLVGSEVLLLAFSRAANSSPWVHRELNAFFMQALSMDKPILPCRLDDAEPPALLADIKYADFRASFDQGMASLLTGIGVMEELRLSRLAASVREILMSSLNEKDRVRCFNTFVAGHGFKLDIFITPPREPEVFELLREHGLIKETDNGNDLHLVATSLGIRVFRPWNPTQGGTSGAVTYPTRDRPRYVR